MRCSEYNDYGETLNVLSIYTDMRIHSGEKVLLNVISIWKVFHFSTCLRKLENSHLREICEYKERGRAFNDVSYIRKYTKILPDAKSVSVLTLENFWVIPVFTDMWELILEGTLGIKSMWGCLSLSSALSGHKIIYTENKKYKCYENGITFINIPCLFGPLAHSSLVFLVSYKHWCLHHQCYPLN